MHGSAPAWLFSFVDLAFLMLMALTLLSPLDAGRGTLGEMQVPRVEEGRVDAARAPAAAYQLRVHPRAGDVQPLELVAPGGEGTRLELPALRARLAALRAFDEARPLVAPHPDSRSEDLLRALAVVEEIWSEERGALVERAAARS
jgi:hypothetical protein